MVPLAASMATFAPLVALIPVNVTALLISPESITFTKIGFEGGQMPLQRRLPKVGFSSRVSIITSQVTLSEIDKLEEKLTN
jgi:hypothetical protein